MQGVAIGRPRGRSPATLGIIVVNYRAAGDVTELVRSLTLCELSSLSVLLVVVENGDEADELQPAGEVALAAGIKVKIISGHGNVGYAGGNNLGAEWLLAQGADVLWILNPDTRVLPGSLRSVAELAGTGAVLAATVRPDGSPDFGVTSGWTGQSGKSDGSGGRGLSYISGHSILATAAAWNLVGGLCEDYFLFYEEADLAVRARTAGIATVVLPDLRVAHHEGRSTGSSTDLRRKSLITYFHASRSCMIFFRQHHPRRLPVAVAARLAYAGRVLVSAGPRPAAAVLRGVVSGLWS